MDPVFGAAHPAQVYERRVGRVQRRHPERQIWTAVGGAGRRARGGNGAEKGSKVEEWSEFTEGPTLRLKGSQSGEGKGSQFMKGFVGEGWKARRGLLGLLVTVLAPGLSSGRLI